MKKLIFFCLVTACLFSSLKSGAQGYTMEAVTGYPFPTELTSSPAGSKIAVAIEEQGKRNVYVAQGPEFTLRKLTSYNKDEGQEITSLSVSADGKWVVYVRGGEHSGNRDRSVVVNPAYDPVIPKIQVWSVPFSGGAPKLLSDGDYAEISPKSDKVAFIKDNAIWMAPIDGSAPARAVATVKGENSAIQWSPNGSQLAFICNRTDHSYIAVYTDDKTSIMWLSPSFSRDASPRWSPDGKKIVFIRTPGVITPPATTATTAAPATGGRGGGGGGSSAWELWTADVATGKGSKLWRSGDGPREGIPSTDGGANLNWAAGDRIVFASYKDGWPHLYSINSTTGGEPLLLTPGEFQAEQIKMSSDGKWMIFSGNTGPDKQLDIDRRHIVRVPVDKPAMEVLTPGTSLETYPVLTGDGSTVAMYSGSPKQPLLMAVLDIATKKTKLIGEKLLPANFPVSQMVIPTQVIYKTPDGAMVHAQLFEATGGPAKKPAIVYIHGGPQRQMLLGWHHMDYYSIDYALNQYLASMGFVVLAVNYRNGIGYGYDWNRPSTQGANYIDVKAGGDWLAAYSHVDSTRIGVYGGSAGGTLTNTALARDSKLFKAGVVIHGGTREAFDKWTSPTLVIHGDDDRNVAFQSGVALTRNLETNGVPFEFLAIPDDSHHWMKYSNVLKVNNAAAEFLKRKLIDNAIVEARKP